MSKFFWYKNNNRGDTIVEVLVAIMVISSVLAGAYVSTRSSINATRTAQERGEALKLAESQVEQIKVAANTGTPDVIAAADFCISAGVLTASCITTTGVAYTTITSHDTGSNEFAVKVTWDGLAGGINSVELDYKTL